MSAVPGGQLSPCQGGVPRSGEGVPVEAAGIARAFVRLGACAVGIRESENSISPRPWLID